MKYLLKYGRQEKCMTQRNTSGSIEDKKSSEVNEIPRGVWKKKSAGLNEIPPEVWKTRKVQGSTKYLLKYERREKCRAQWNTSWSIYDKKSAGLNEIPPGVWKKKSAGLNEIPSEIWKTRKKQGSTKYFLKYRKTRKVQGSTKYLLKYGRQEKSRAQRNTSWSMEDKKSAGLIEIPPEVWKTRKFDDILFFDFAIPCLNKTQQRNGRKTTCSPFLRKAISVSQRMTSV